MSKVDLQEKEYSNYIHDQKHKQGINVGIRQKISKLNILIDFFQKIASIIALICAGIWFLQSRESYPRANIDQKVSHINFPDKNKLVLVHMSIRNYGKVRISLKTGIVRIERLLPLNSKLKEKVEIRKEEYSPQDISIAWDTLQTIIPSWNKENSNRIIIEPGEVHDHTFEFIISSSENKKIRVFSSIEYDHVNAKKDNDPLSWVKPTYYDLNTK